MMRLIVPLIMLAVSAGVFFGFISPTYDEIKDLRTQKAVRVDALDNANKLKLAADDLQQKYNQFTDDSKMRLERLLPENVDNIKLILEIENIAGKYGMTLKNVKFDTTQADLQSASAGTTQFVGSNAEILAAQKRDYAVFDMGFSTIGAYPNFVAFMADLEKSLRLVDVTSVAFSVPDAGTGATLGATPSVSSSNVYKYDFKVKTYWLKN